MKSRRDGPEEERDAAMRARAPILGRNSTTIKKQILAACGIGRSRSRRPPGAGAINRAVGCHNRRPFLVAAGLLKSSGKELLPQCARLGRYAADVRHTGLLLLRGLLRLLRCLLGCFLLGHSSSS
jgi:hypothetical protein